MDSSRPWVIRCEQFLDRRFTLVVGCLLVVALLSGWVAFAEFHDPETVNEEVVVDTWNDQAGFEHFAIVEEQNEDYPVGQRMENESSYYTNITPNLQGVYQYEYTSAERGSLDVEIELTLLVRNLEDGTVHWSVEEPLDSHRAIDVGPDDPQSVGFSVNMSELYDRQEQLVAERGGTAETTESLVRAEMTVEGQVNGEPISRVGELHLRLEPDPALYEVENPGAEANTYETSEVVERPLDPRPERLYGFGGLAIAAIIGVAGLNVARRRDVLAPSANTVVEVKTARERQRFGEWITPGELPAELRDQPQIRLDSLEDLVHVAQDCDSPVIDAPEEQLYYVIDGDVVYAFEP